MAPPLGMLVSMVIASLPVRGHVQGYVESLICLQSAINVFTY